MSVRAPVIQTQQTDEDDARLPMRIPIRSHFANAEAISDGKSLKLFFELSTGGYNGSTYTLIYDPQNDVLKGVYFQAVLQRTFDVLFTRAK